MPSENAPPSIPGWFQGGFHAFLGPYLRRHFHSIAIANDGWQPSSLTGDEPLIVYGNHPSWWDPLIAHYLNLTQFKPRQFYAPIDAEALEQYKVFAKLGFYGVNLSSHRGAAAFLKQSLAILNHPRTSLWITPEGRFCDVRDFTAPLMPGLAHLCTKLDRGCVVPMALEFVFWEERLPECLIRFGQPLQVADCAGLEKSAWNERLTQNLRDAQQALTSDSIARDSHRFTPTMRGAVGAGGTYDMMRRIKSLLSGKKLRLEHGEKLK
jgi:1-acyl-sn-glycerol-3-phosphate acyltransferase